MILHEKKTLIEDLRTIRNPQHSQSSKRWFVSETLRFPNEREQFDEAIILDDD